MLGLVSLLLGILIALRLRPANVTPPVEQSQTTSDRGPTDDAHHFQWLPYLLLVSSAAISGLIYGGVLHFLPRYLEESGAMQFAGGNADAAESKE